MSRWRTVLAFCIVPLVISLSVTIFDDLWEWRSLNWRRILSEAEITLSYAYAVTIVLGIPTYFLLTGFRLLSPFTIMLTAAMMASFPLFTFWATGPHDGDVAGLAVMIPRLARISVEGLVAGIAFWLIARPELRAAPDASLPHERRARSVRVALSILLVITLFSLAVIPATLMLAGIFVGLRRLVS